MAIIAAVGFVVVFLLDLEVNTRQLIASVCIGVGFIVSAWILFNHILLKLMGIPLNDENKKRGGERLLSVVYLICLFKFNFVCFRQRRGVI